MKIILYVFVCCIIRIFANEAVPEDTSFKGLKNDSILSKPESDTGRLIFNSVFKQRRQDHHSAVKRIMELDNYEKQYKMVALVAEKVFTSIEECKATLESQGFVAGLSPFPKEEKLFTALSNLLEMTALFSDILIKVPEITHKILSMKRDWEVLFTWSIAFSAQTHFLDDKTMKLMNLVEQELNMTERDPDYINPYRKPVQATRKIAGKEDMSKYETKHKKKKLMKRGPRISTEL